MIDHIMLMVKEKEKSEEFYASVLAVLGHSLVHSSADYTGFGKAGHVPFWLKKAQEGHLSHRVHIAFLASSTELVDQFYEVALRFGASSNGAPGPRPEHGDHYYAAYVYDLDGHNIEAVCYQKEMK